MRSDPSILAAAVDGDRRAADQVAAALRTDGGDTDVLDQVALEAASGSAIALDLLLAAVDDLDLTRAAIRRLILDQAAVDDVAQDVLIAVAEKVDTFRGDARFTTWLHQVAKFKAIDHLRRQRDAVSLDDATTAPPSDAVRMSSMIANRTTIRVAVDELPEHYRVAVVLRDIERLSYHEVAERAGIPLNTAKTRVARGRALLAGKLAAGAR